MTLGKIQGESPDSLINSDHWLKLSHIQILRLSVPYTLILKAVTVSHKSQNTVLNMI